MGVREDLGFQVLGTERRDICIWLVWAGALFERSERNSRSNLKCWTIIRTEKSPWMSSRSDADAGGELEELRLKSEEL